MRAPWRFLPSVLPNVVTLGNAVCGFAALVKVTQGNYTAAAWLVLLAMVFDALDGTVARWTHYTSNLGGQLDSLSDMVSFGVAPAVLVAVMAATAGAHPLYPKVAWCFAVLYALGTALRLARFNLQEDPGESSHTSFMGLPSPAAAGTVASLVLLSDYLVSPGNPVSRRVPEELAESAAHALLLVMPVLALLLGGLMVSRRIRYTHVVSRWVRARFARSADGRKAPRLLRLASFLVILALVGLVFMFRELALAVAFCVYTLTGPIGSLVSGLLVSHEAEDEGDYRAKA